MPGKLTQRWGMTFIEVMLSFMIFSTGLVMIYKGFLKATDIQRQVSCRLYAMTLMAGQADFISVQLWILPFFPNERISQSHEAIIGNRRYAFQTDTFCNLLDKHVGLLQFDVIISWKEREKVFQLTKSFYAQSLYNIKE